MKANIFQQFKFNTLRNRLTFWYLSSIILLFALVTLLFTITFDYTLKSQIDHHLRIVINEARQIIANYPDHQRIEMLKNLVSEKGMTIVLLSPDGSPLLQTNSQDVATVTQHQIQQVISSSQLKHEPTHFTVGEIRFATILVEDSNGPSVLAVGYSTSIEKQIYKKIIIGISVALFIISITLSLIGHKLLKKYLTPLEDIARSSRAISSSHDLTTKIMPLPPTQELRDIASAFNQMLRRLQQVFATEHQFFSDTAHTLKTPLAVLRSGIEGLTHESKKTTLPLLQTIDQAVDIIQDLLLISRLQTFHHFETEKLSLTTIVENLAELARVLGTNKQLIIKKSIQKNIVVHANQKLLTKAMGNIINNAVEHSKKHGTIHINLKQKNDRIILTISDTGEGISKRDLPRVFNRFYQGVHLQKKAGSGLGLAISQAIIKNLGGTILLRSQLTKGTKVILSLPTSA